jgi:SP family arabinose:H+ symporter-like MFS transporter
MHQMTGVNAYISQMGFVTATFDHRFGDYVPFMMGAVQVITAIYAVVYLTKVSRKSLVLIGNLGMSLCCVGIGISYELTGKFPNTFWAIVGLIVIFMGFHGATLVPGVWTYIP